MSRPSAPPGRGMKKFPKNRQQGMFNAVGSCILTFVRSRMSGVAIESRVRVRELVNAEKR